MWLTGTYWQGHPSQFPCEWPCVWDRGWWGVVEGRLPLFLPPAETQELAHRGRGQEMCWKSLSVQHKKCWPSLQTHLRSNDENMTMIHEGELCCPNGEIYLLNEKRIWSFKRLQRNIPILILTSWEIGLLLSLISISCFKCIFRIFHVYFISSRWCKWTSNTYEGLNIQRLWWIVMKGPP